MPRCAPLVAHDAGALIVARESGRIVGTVIAGWDGWRGSVYRLVVAPDCRRSGLGRQLVQSAERRLAELGAQRMQAIVVGPDARAMGFWSATEWDLQGDQVRFVKGVGGRTARPLLLDQLYQRPERRLRVHERHRRPPRPGAR